MFKMMSKRLNGNQQGFTLMELIIVMAVIGILVLLAIPKFQEFKEKAELTRIKNDLKVLENLVATKAASGEVNEGATYEAKEGLITKKGQKANVEVAKVKEVVDDIENSFTTELKDTFYVDKEFNVYYEGTNFNTINLPEANTETSGD